MTTTNPNQLNAHTGKGCRMASSLLSISSIVSAYSDRSVWAGVCGVILSDGTRLVATALGDGFRIYRESMGHPIYVPFA